MALFEAPSDKVSNGPWQASSWFLARKYPEEFAQTSKHALTNAAGKDLTPNQRQKLIDAIIEERKGLVER